MILVFLIGNTNILADMPNLDDIEKNISQRVRSYNGLEFSIMSNFYQENSQGEKIKSLPSVRETLRLHFPEKGPAWKYWVQEIQDKFDKKWIHNYFKVTNVSETRNFAYTPEGEGKWSKGSVIPWYVWDEQDGCMFSTFLAMNTSGLSLLAFEFSETLKNKLLSQKIDIVDGKIIDGVQTIILRSRDEKFGVENETHITIPHFLVVHREIRGIKEKFSMIYHVEKLGFFEKICYPQKGSFNQSAIKYLDKENYKFEVIDVYRFDTAFLNNWFPEWQPSTVVSEVKTGNSVIIPPSERQLKKVAEEWNSYNEQSEHPYWSVVRIVLMILGSILILISLFLMIRKRYKK
jgi:hypothetical protein